MDYLEEPVAYLQDSDFDSNGTLTNPDIPNIPVVVMIQAKFCGYCKEAKPAFQEFARKAHGKVFAATIQGDGDQPGETDLMQRIEQIKPGFRGYPEYVLIKNGKVVNKEIRGRGVADLVEFASG